MTHEEIKVVFQAILKYENLPTILDQLGRPATLEERQLIRELIEIRTQ